MDTIKILYDNKNFTVCIKESGFLSEDNGNPSVKNSLPVLLAAQLEVPRLYTVHRLDKEVSGVMVYAKNKETAATLSKQIAENKFTKEYLAVVSGKVENNSEELRHLLFHDRIKNKTYVVNRKRNGVKEAILKYTVLKYNEIDDSSVLRIRLYTGRTHQIRVQLSHIGHPICGDKKYGSGISSPNILLHSFLLSFYDTQTSKKIVFTAMPEWMKDATVADIK